MRTLAVLVLVYAVLAPSHAADRIHCARHCTYYGHDIISCERASRHDILSCYQQHPHASVLDLGFTDLHHISKGLFDGLHRIKRLYMDHTEPYSVDDDSFDDMTDLQAVSLRSVGPGVTMFVPSLTKCTTLLSVNLAGNFLNCTCEWLYLADEIGQHNIVIEDATSTPRCTETDRQACRDIEFRRAAKSKWMFLGIGVAAGVLVVIIAITVTLRLCKPSLFQKKGSTEDTEYQVLYNETNQHLKKMAEDTMRKIGSGPLLSNLKNPDKEPSEEKKTKHTSDHIFADAENEEIRNVFLEEMAKRRSAHSAVGESDSDDADLAEVVRDPLGKASKTPVISNMLNKMSSVFSRKSAPEVKPEPSKKDLDDSSDKEESSDDSSWTSMVTKSSSDTDSRAGSAVTGDSSVSGATSKTSLGVQSNASSNNNEEQLEPAEPTEPSEPAEPAKPTESVETTEKAVPKQSAKSLPAVDSILSHRGRRGSIASIGAKSTSSKASRKTIENDAELMALLVEWVED